jgi:hypothetical protein
VIKLRVLLAVSAGLLLAGCGGTPSGDPTAGGSSTPTATETATASPTPTTPPVVAGYELSGSVLISVEADGTPIEDYVLGDPDSIIAELTNFLGAPYIGEAAPGCGLYVAVWPDEFGSLVYAHVPGGGGTPMLIVKDGSFSIQPSEGPRFGEPGEPFASALPAGSYDPGYAYVYDSVGTTAIGAPFGGTAFLDGDGRVSSLASPSVAAGTDFC